MPGIVMLQSLFIHNPAPIDVYVIQSDLTANNIELMRRLIEKHNGTMHIISIPQAVFENAHTSIHITKESYYRLLAQELLPGELERVLQETFRSSTTTTCVGTERRAFSPYAKVPASPGGSGIHMTPSRSPMNTVISIPAFC